MMKWAIIILGVLDSIYQLFGQPNSAEWYLFYDLLHYGFGFAVCVYFIHDRLIRFVSVYFLGVILALVAQYFRGEGLDFLEPLYFWPFFLLSLTVIYLIPKKWVK